MMRVGLAYFPYACYIGLHCRILLQMNISPKADPGPEYLSDW